MDVKETINIDELWDFGNPKGSYERFSSLLEPSRIASANYYGEVLSQIARTQSIQGNLDEAHLYLNKQAQLLKSDLSTSSIRYHLERGRCYNSNKEKQLASRYFVIAFTLAFKMKEDFYAVDAAHMLGISEPSEKQISWHELALEIAEKSEQKRAKKWLGSLYNNLGWTYHDQGDFNKALTVFTKALELREAQKDIKGSLIAKWTIARCYRSLGRIKDALAMQKALLNDYQAHGLESAGYGHEEIGECLLKLNNNKEAAQYFAIAYNLLKEETWLQKNEKERLERMSRLSL